MREDPAIPQTGDLGEHTGLVCFKWRLVSILDPALGVKAEPRLIEVGYSLASKFSPEPFWVLAAWTQALIWSSAPGKE